MATEQIEKLPQWAQKKIRSLESSIEDLEQRLSEYQGNAETNTYINQGLDRKPIENNAQIEFLTGDKKQNKTRVYINRDGFIDVNTDSPCTTVIMPRAANSFYITFIKRT